MQRSGWKCVLCALAALAGSGCVKYQPRPVAPPALEQKYRARGLDNPELRAFLESSGWPVRPWPPARLDPALLTAIAAFYNPELEVARAHWRSIRAALVTAGVRPNPSLSAGAGYANSPESNRVFHFDPGFLIETAGKRRLRILRAQAAAETARLEVLETAWRIRSRIRTLTLDHVFALEMQDLLKAEATVRSESAEMLERRLVAGEVSRPDVDLARLDLIQTRLALRAAETQAAESLASLASAAGLPMAALRQIRFERPKLPAESVRLEKIQKAGLLHRVDVQRALVEYAAAEADLQLEVARQYPDILLTPGYSFDEGHHKFMFSPALPVPVFQRNRGPIAEAAAKREEFEKRFAAVQAQAIGEMERAEAGYRSAWEEFREADRQMGTVQRAREAAVRKAFDAGEEDRLALAGARVQTAVLARAALDTRKKLQAAEAALEDAVQQPLDGEPAPRVVW